VEGLGADALVTLTNGDNVMIMRTPSDARPNENETVGLTLNLHKLHLFDPTSRATILRQAQNPQTHGRSRAFRRLVTRAQRM
jgi:hypothetical protein